MRGVSGAVLLALVPVAALGLAACGPGTDQPVDASPQPRMDGGDPMMDAMQPDVDAPIPITEHLLLSEVTLTPTEAEFIEIYNPSDRAVDLTNYYLADDHEYARLPGLSGATSAPALSSADFIAQFPPGASIGAGEVRVIARDYVAFNTQFGINADYALLDAPGGQAMVDPGGLIPENPTLTNAGEAIVLFFWDGTSDLVDDIDLVHAGAPTGENLLSNKQADLVDGPDPGGNPSTYRNDALTLGDHGTAAIGGQSHKRIASEDGFETQSGGNGIINHDETSEMLSMTWDAMDVFTAPNPGVAEPGLIGP